MKEVLASQRRPEYYWLLMIIAVIIIIIMGVLPSIDSSAMACTKAECQSNVGQKSVENSSAKPRVMAAKTTSFHPK